MSALGSDPNANMGTAFPTDGLFQGKPWFRTDLMVQCWYDLANSRWVGPEIPVAVHNYRGSPPFAATEEVLACSIRIAYRLLLTSYTVSYYTGGGVDGSNYWRMYLRRLNASIGIDNIVYIQTTSNSWHKPTPDKVTADFSNNPLAVGDIWLQNYIEKTGTPNSLYIQSDAIYGRFIYT